MFLKRNIFKGHKRRNISTKTDEINCKASVITCFSIKHERVFLIKRLRTNDNKKPKNGQYRNLENFY